MKISTRIADAADTDEIIALWKRFIEECENTGYEEVEQSWAERLRTQIASSKVIVAANDGSLIGFVGFIDHADQDWVPEHIAYVVDIYVAPEARPSTAAKSLFAAVSGLLKCSYSETWTNTHVENTRMQVLLKRAGFRRLDGFEIAGLQDQLYYIMDNN